MALFAVITASTKTLDVILAHQSGGELGKCGRLELYSSDVRPIRHVKKSWNNFRLVYAAPEYTVDVAGRGLQCLHEYMVVGGGWWMVGISWKKERMWMVGRREKGIWFGKGKSVDGWMESDRWKKGKRQMVRRREKGRWFEEWKKVDG